MFGRRVDDAMADMAGQAVAEGDRRMGDVRRFAADLDGLMARARTLPSESAAAARDEIERRLGQLRDSFDDAREAAMERAQYAIDTTESYVRREPWKAMAIVAGVGAAIGLIVALTATRERY